MTLLPDPPSLRSRFPHPFHNCTRLKVHRLEGVEGGLVHAEIEAPVIAHPRAACWQRPPLDDEVLGEALEEVTAELSGRRILWNLLDACAGEVDLRDVGVGDEASQSPERHGLEGAIPQAQLIERWRLERVEEQLELLQAPASMRDIERGEARKVERGCWPGCVELDGAVGEIEVFEVLEAGEVLDLIEHVCVEIELAEREASQRRERRRHDKRREEQWRVHVTGERLELRERAEGAEQTEHSGRDVTTLKRDGTQLQGVVAASQPLEEVALDSALLEHEVLDLLEDGARDDRRERLLLLARLPVTNAVRTRDPAIRVDRVLGAVAADEQAAKQPAKKPRVLDGCSQLEHPALWRAGAMLGWPILEPVEHVRQQLGDDLSTVRRVHVSALDISHHVRERFS